MLANSRSERKAFDNHSTQPQAQSIRAQQQQVPEHQTNPFKDRHPSQSAASNFDGGPLYGVNERDNWLLAKDEVIDAASDEVHRSQPNLV